MCKMPNCHTVVRNSFRKMKIITRYTQHGDPERHKPYQGGDKSATRKSKGPELHVRSVDFVLTKTNLCIFNIIAFKK